MNAFCQQTWAQLARWLLHLSREPFHITFTLIQPLFWMLLFSNSFQNMSQGELIVRLPADRQPDYRTFFAAGVLAFTAFGNAMSGGIPLLFDKESGFLTRLLSTPASRASIVMARFLYVSIVSCVQVLLILGLAMLMGVRIATGPAGVAAVLGFTVLLGAGFTVLSLSMAFLLHGHGEFFAILGVLNLPLLFTSSALVPVERMPGWLAFLARFNPLTYAVDGYRSLVAVGWEPMLLLRLAGMLALIDLVLGWLGVWTFRRKLSG